MEHYDAVLQTGTLHYYRPPQQYWHACIINNAIHFAAASDSFQPDVLINMDGDRFFGSAFPRQCLLDFSDVSLDKVAHYNNNEYGTDGCIACATAAFQRHSYVHIYIYVYIYICTRRGAI